jgi:hypothetical protein
VATATYVSDSTFIVDGNYTDPQMAPRGLPIVAVLDSGDVRTSVNTAIYDVNTDTTLISVTEPVLDATLSAVKQYRLLYVDDDSQTGSLVEHDHSAQYQGGSQAFAGFTDSDVVAFLNALVTTLESGAALQILRRTTDNSDIEWIDAALGALVDVELTSPSDGQVLKYDSGAGLWKNASDESGGGGGGSTSVGSWAGYYMGL